MSETVCKWCSHELIAEKVPGWISKKTMAQYCGGGRPDRPNRVHEPAEPAPQMPPAKGNGCLTYDHCTKADADAAEQWSVAYVARVGASKETMIDAISTMRAQLLTYQRAMQKIGQIVEMPELLGRERVTDALLEILEALSKESGRAGGEG